MKTRIATELNNETLLKLTRKAARVGLNPSEALKIIATKGVRFFFATWW